MKEFFSKIKKELTIAIIIGLGLYISYLLFTYLEPFSNFGIFILLFGIAIALWWAIDKFLWPDIDTFEEIKKGNVAVGLMMIAYSILVFGAMLCAFVIFVNKGSTVDLPPPAIDKAPINVYVTPPDSTELIKYLPKGSK